MISERRICPSFSWLPVAVGAVVLLAGCRQDMHDQARYEPMEESDFFLDQRASRELIEGTVSRGSLDLDPAVATGKNPDGSFVESLPYQLDRALLERGRNRFDIYCSPCHDRLGEGHGMVVQRGYRKPPSLHDQRLRDESFGYFVDVMTQGFGVMSSYAVQVEVEDRWAIAAYIRALQLSQKVSADDLDDDDRLVLAGGGVAGSHGEVKTDEH